MGLSYILQSQPFELILDSCQVLFHRKAIISKTSPMFHRYDFWVWCPSGEFSAWILLINKVSQSNSLTVLKLHCKCHSCVCCYVNIGRTWHAVSPLMSSLVNDESSRDAEVTAREHMGSSSSLQSREEKQEPVVVRPYPQVQMLSTHHAVASGTPVTVTAPPAHLTPAVPLSFSEGLMKVMERFKITHWSLAKDWLVFLTMFTKS